MAKEPMHLIVLKLDDKNLEDFCKKMREAPLKLEAFRDEVEGIAQKLHHGLRRCEETEARKVTAEGDYVHATMDIRAATDRAADMKEERKRVAAVTAATQQRIAGLQEQIQQDDQDKAFYEKEIEKVEKALEVGPGWTADQLRSKEATTREIEGRQRQQDRKASELKLVMSDNENGEYRCKQLNDNLAAARAELQEIRHTMLELRQMRNLAVEGKKEEQAKLQESHAEHGQLMEILPMKEKDIEDERHATTEVQSQILALKKDLDAGLGQLEKVKLAESSAKTKLAEIEGSIKATRIAVEEAKKDIKTTLDTAEKTKQERIALEDNEKVTVVSNIQQTEEERTAADTRKVAIVQERADGDRDIASANREGLQREREHEAIKMQLITLNKKTTSAADRANQAAELIEIMKGQSAALDNDLTLFRKSVREKTEHVRSLRSDIMIADKLATENKRKNEAAMLEANAMSVREMELLDMIKDLEGQANRKTSELKAVGEERRRQRGKSLEVQKDITVQRDLFTNVARELAHLKETLASEMRTSLRLHFDQFVVGQDLQKLREKHAETKDNDREAWKLVAIQEKDIFKLEKLHEETTQESHKLEMEIAAVEREQRQLQAKLQEAMDEVENSKQQVKLRQDLLAFGHKQYEGILVARATVFRKLALVKAEVSTVESQSVDTGDVEAEIQQLEKELRAEQLRSTTLEVEAGRKLNVHRWKHLEVTDPEKHEIIQRIMRLQKQIVKTAQQVAKIETEVEERQGVMEKLSATLKRGAKDEMGVTPKDKLDQLKEIFKERQANLDRLSEELDMYRQQVRIYGHELEAMQGEQAALVQTWLGTVREQQRMAEAQVYGHTQQQVEKQLTQELQETQQGESPLEQLGQTTQYHIAT